MTITGRRSSPRPSRWPPGTSISPLMLSFIQIAAAIILPRSSPPCWNGWRSASPWAGPGYVSTIAWRNHSMPRSKSSGPIVPSTRRGKRPGRILPATSNSGIIGFVSSRLSTTGPLKRPTTSTWTGSSQHEIVPIQLSGKREASQSPRCGVGGREGEGDGGGPGVVCRGRGGGRQGGGGGGSGGGWGGKHPGGGGGGGAGG